jgi:large subunit ribosomal protein L10
LNRKEKEMVVADVHGRLSKAKAVFITDFTGIGVESLNRLRRELKGRGIEYRVVKNSLIHRALDQTPMAGLKDKVVGPTGLAISYQDPVAMAKVLKEFSKDSDKAIVKWGLLEGKAISAKEVFDLSALPPREVLLAQVLSVMLGPPTHLVGVLSGVTRKFLGVLTALKQKTEQAS